MSPPLPQHSCSASGKPGCVEKAIQPLVAPLIGRGWGNGVQDCRHPIGVCGQELIAMLLAITQTGIFIARSGGHPNRILDAAQLTGEVRGIDDDMRCWCW